MGTFLDLRTSSNATSNINSALGAPSLFGIVGLQTQGVAGPIVDLSGLIGLQAGVLNARARINVVRGTLLTDTIIYTSDITLVATGENQNVAIDAQDLSAPAALQTTYSAFVSLLAGTVSRVGPETFWGIASRT